MISLRVQVKNLDELRSNFAKAPAITLNYLSKATKAAIFDIEKQAVDSNFRFKWPRAMRTGYLQLSFSFGRYFSSSGLRASIGPTAHYAPYVYSGTRRGMRPNPYMDRIANAAQPDVQMHFGQALDAITAQLARV